MLSKISIVHCYDIFSLYIFVTFVKLANNFAKLFWKHRLLIISSGKSPFSLASTPSLYAGKITPNVLLLTMIFEESNLTDVLKLKQLNIRISCLDSSLHKGMYWDSQIPPLNSKI